MRISGGATASGAAGSATVGSMTPTPVPPDPLAAVERDLEALEAVPLEEQAAVFEEMHRVVTEVLAGTALPPEPHPGTGAQ